MPALRARKSSISAHVTLYEPVAALSSPNAAADAGPPLATISPLRRTTRSLTTPSSGARRVVKLEHPDSDDAIEDGFEAAAALDDGRDAEPLPESKPAPRPRSPRKPTPRKVKLDVPHPAPKRWQETYAAIERQRSGIVAPVDTMGCDQQHLVNFTRKDKKLSTLVSLMLSSQTRDEITDHATRELRSRLPGGLTVESLEAATIEEIDECIKKVGFHNTKALNLKKMAKKVREEHDGEVPEDLDKLLEFNGVGPKMAFLAMSSFGHNIGIGVDTHVHRITHRLRWHRKEPKNPEETRLNLESWLPQELWPKINKMLVGFGQEICRPIGPRCNECHLSTLKLCPSRRIVPSTTSPSKNKRVKLEHVEAVKVEAEVKAEGGAIDEGKPKVKIGFEEVVKVEEDGHFAISQENVKVEV
ncbi:hypothetical protein JCM10212_000340 [Sporobolomyces blumeae]